MQILEKLNSVLFSPLLVMTVLLTGGILFVRFGYLVFTRPGRTLSAFKKRGKEKNGISPFKSVALALASTMGVGNIVGVSTAIAAGGPGAVFWMVASALVAMSVKYAEVCLGVSARKRVFGVLHGGAPYYFEKYAGRALAAGFACLLLVNSLTVGNIVQTNALSESVAASFGTDPRICGALFFVLCAFSLMRKNKKIENMTSIAVTLATLLFCVFSVAAVVRSFDKLGQVFILIFKNAFSFRAAAAGGMGYTASKAIRFGVTRGIMSNEAGSGTSPTAHSLSSNGPAEQGIFGVLEVFVDTVVTCSLTALVILLAYGDSYSGMTGMELALGAFGKFFGRRAEVVLTLSVAIFAYATVISQFYYGREALFFITRKRSARAAFDAVFMFLIYLGAVMPVGILWQVTDLNVCVMTSVNCAMILCRSGEIKKVTYAFYNKVSKNKRDFGDEKTGAPARKRRYYSDGSGI